MPLRLDGFGIVGGGDVSPVAAAHAVVGAVTLARSQTSRVDTSPVVDTASSSVAALTIRVLPLTAPAVADPLDAPLGPPPVEGAPAASSGREGPATYSVGPGSSGFGLVTDTATVPVAPGLTLTEFDRFDPDGWVRGDTLKVDLNSDTLAPTYLSPGAVSARAPLSEQAVSSDEAAVVVARGGVTGARAEVIGTGAFRPMPQAVGEAMMGETSTTGQIRDRHR